MSDSKHIDGSRCKSLYASVAICWILVAAMVVDHISGQLGREDISVYDTVNPNIASLDSLVRLEGIGQSTAESIIEYRQNTPEGKKAFTKPADLQGVKGIGPKTVEKIEPWLNFE